MLKHSKSTHNIKLKKLDPILCLICATLKCIHHCVPIGLWSPVMMPQD